MSEATAELTDSLKMGALWECVMNAVLIQRLSAKDILLEKMPKIKMGRDINVMYRRFIFYTCTQIQLNKLLVEFISSYDCLDECDKELSFEI